MSDSDCARTIEWPGGKHTFNLDHPWVRKVLTIRGLPGAFGATEAACLKRFEEGLYSTDDVERVIELGLIGGGMTRPEADKLVREHVKQKSIAPNAVIAFEVLAALFVGKGA